jgi:APA family basic amino acid/polyamine antiporter
MVGAPGSGFLAALLPVLWSYDGTTDCVKLAEEVRDVRRALPLAVIGSTLALTALYIAVNLALLRIVPASEMVDVASVPGEAMARLFGPLGGVSMLLMAMLVCIGSLGSTIPATVRVTFALARDGLTFRRLAAMSPEQAPVPALLVVGAITTFFALTRSFTEVLGIYFLAATILFGLSYGSLLVFRSRETTFPVHVFRCPGGRMLAVLVIAVQSAIAVQVIVHQPVQALYTAGLLVLLAAIYLIWPRRAGEPIDGE